VSPKAVQYRANSIIYFKGDTSDRVYLLNSGKVSLNYIDIESGQEVHDLIKMGEFFGVKSGLGRYPREETAVVLQDSGVMAFTPAEFEQLAAKNTRIITKMLKVFSNQLRRIHRQVQTLLVSDAQENPETGLYKIGEYYLKNKRYGQALHAFKRYLVYYPSGSYAGDVTNKIVQAEEFVSRYGAGGSAASAPLRDARASVPSFDEPAKAPSREPPESPRPEKTAELSETAQGYYNAISLVSQEKFLDAFKAFKKIIESGAGDEYGAKAEFEMAKCLFHLKQYDNCVRSFSTIVQKYPKHPDMREALFFVARSYEEKGDGAKASGLYKKIMTMAGEDDPIVRRARKALKAMEGDKA
jgi:TolA-binding protein